MSGGYVPERGDIVWINFDPQAGHEQLGRRPAVVLSPAGYNGLSGLVVVCPVTSRRKGYRYEVPIPSGLPVTGVALADQIKNLDWTARNAVFDCRVPDRFLDDVIDAVAQLIS